MRHAKSRLVEDADESAPVRLKTAPTGGERSGTSGAELRHTEYTYYFVT